MFFLPWFSACGLSVSGSDLAFGAALDPQTLKSLTAPTTYPWLALVLLCGLVPVIVAAVGLFVRPPALRFRRVRPLFLLGAGGLALLLLGIVLLSYFDQTTNRADVVNVEYGFMGSALGALLILVGAIIDFITAPRPAPETVEPADAPEITRPAAPPPGSAVLSPPAPVGQNRFVLRGQSGALAGQVFELSGDRITLGRTLLNQIRIPDRGASRVHAVIRYVQGRYYLQDQESTTGTLINGQPVIASVLNDGDVFTVGGATFEFRVRE
jgi:hypothetical protein